MGLFDEDTYKAMQGNAERIKQQANAAHNDENLTQCAFGLVGFLNEIFADERLAKFLFNTNSDVVLYRTKVGAKATGKDVDRTYGITGIGVYCKTDDPDLFSNSETYRFGNPFNAMGLALQLARDSKAKLKPSDLEDKLKSYVHGKLCGSQ
ncbi:MAG: hypothetical protein QME12_03775 [Nanoarchaeota archaeon]|nr:hypothetical protein [Nanoarchaeota archaeon]